MDPGLRSVLFSARCKNIRSCEITRNRISVMQIYLYMYAWLATSRHLSFNTQYTEDPWWIIYHLGISPSVEKRIFVIHCIMNIVSVFRHQVIGNDCIQCVTWVGPSSIEMDLNRPCRFRYNYSYKSQNYINISLNDSVCKELTDQET